MSSVHHSAVGYQKSEEGGNGMSSMTAAWVNPKLPAYSLFIHFNILPDMAISKAVTESRHDGARSLVCSAYQNNDINEFEKILKTNRRNIMEDPFIREHIEGG